MTREETLVQYAKYVEKLFEKLDEEMASEERIAEDIKHCGGFISGLNLTETEDDIVGRVCNAIDFTKDFANEPCDYSDNCPVFGGSRHGTCKNCLARQALGWQK